MTGDQTKSIEITFSDVIGLEDAKEALEDAIILPLKHPDIYAQQNNGKNYLLVTSTITVDWGSGGGPVGRAVASYTTDPQFEFQHRQHFIYQLYF